MKESALDTKPATVLPSVSVARAASPTYRHQCWPDRLFNATLAATALVVLAIPLLVVAIAIKLSSRGPVFFRQVRVGYRGRPFRIYKFRTMEQECRTSESGTLFDDNRRATIVGRVLRDWKIDELPQLVNVLAGDMNIVGPRPEVPEFVGKYCEPDKSIILSASPGITDFASIRFRHEEQILARMLDPRAYYERVLMPSKLRYCRFYVRRANLRLNLYIIAQTVFVLSGDLLRSSLLTSLNHRSLSRALRSRSRMNSQSVGRINTTAS
jgi:lipopolysaccharide/colanic/teichoic acid biosynthesis glycosyltransferase